MRPIIPISRPFDQSTFEQMRDADPVVQRYRARFALFDWSAIDPPPQARSRLWPAHPKSAYLKAALVRISEYLLSTPRWRAYLLDHPLLVLELGFRPHIDLTPALWLQCGENRAQRPSFEQHRSRSLDPRLLANLFEQSVQALQQEIPGLGEVVAYDVKHIYANVKENNFRAYVPERFKKDQQPAERSRLPSAASKRVPTRCKPMAPPKKKRNSSGATAPAWRPPPIPSTAMSCSLISPCPSMKATSPTSCRSTSRPWPCSLLFPSISPLMPPLTPGMSTRPVRTRCGIAAIPLNQHAHPVYERDA